MGEEQNKFGLVIFVLGALGLFLFLLTTAGQFFLYVPYELFLFLRIFSLICSVSSIILGRNLYFREGEVFYGLIGVAFAIVALVLFLFIFVMYILLAAAG